MSSIRITEWDGLSFVQKMTAKALDGIEEWAKTVWLTQARTDCPVDTGTMRNSLTTDRDERAVYVGGGGPAAAYIHRQEVDRSLNHRTGKAGFIRDSAEMHMAEIPAFIKKHSQ